MRCFLKSLATTFFLLCLSSGASHAQPAMNALIVYDAPTGTPYDKLGKAYSIMLRNLLGHFEGAVADIPAQDYTAGLAENYSTIFYLGSNYDSPLPNAFLLDVATTNKTVVWFHYNLWQLAWNPVYNFDGRFGMQLTHLAGMNAEPSCANPAPGFFDTVLYKGKSMVKYYSYNCGTNTINADPDVGAVTILDPGKATALVQIKNTKSGALLPYVTRSGNFWYVADMPFSFIGPRDRYLVLADLLHDMLGIDHPPSHPGMVRLEDVHADVDPAHMKTLTDYLYARRIPFSIAAIPLYLDPLGVWNHGVPKSVPLALASDLQQALNYAVARGAQIVQHGYTHQYGTMRNTISAVSSEDFEFWDAVHNTPVPEDSPEYTTLRVLAGKADLIANGYNPVAWETPHYQASAKSMRAIPTIYPKTYQRAVYYTADEPDFNAPVGKDFAVGQFFPYVIQRDYYGQKVIPENLGNFEYKIDDTSIVYTWEDIRTNAEYALVVRDGFGSFFFHPFLLDADLKLDAFGDFRKLVEAMTSLGYTWTGPASIP